MNRNAVNGACCRSCGSSRLTTFLALGDLPLSAGFTATFEQAVAAPRFPLDVAFCHDCALVQILETVPPDQLFGDDYPYFSSVIGTLLAHSKANVDARIRDRALGADSLVIELASNDGYLLQYYRDAGIPHLGIDPAKGPVDAALAKGIDTLHAFFGDDLARQLRADGKLADVIHANNVLAHVADTNGFVAGIATLLKADGVAVIEVPYVRELIEQGQFDTIYHEHLCYFSVTALVKLFARHGLKLNRVEQVPIHGGSLRLFVGHREEADGSTAALLAKEKAAGLADYRYYAGFARRVETIRDDLRTLLRELKAGGRRVVGYGAAAKGVIMLNYAGIGSDMLDWVADKNPVKQGMWIPGVAVPIVAPSRIAAEQPDHVLILPWNFATEIIRQEATFAARGGRFIVPVPAPRELTAEDVAAEVAA